MTDAEIAQKIEEIKGSLFLSALKLTKNKEDSEDLVQNATLKILLNKDRWEPTGTFKSWADKIMLNIFFDSCRKKKGFKCYSPPKDKNSGNNRDVFEYVKTRSENLESCMEKKELLENVLGVFVILSQKTPAWKMYVNFMLGIYEGLSYQEIADKYEKPLNTVKMGIRRVRCELFKQFPETARQVEQNHKFRRARKEN